MENLSHFKPFGLKIINVKDNKDRYPDLSFILENGKEIPAEVEWKSSNFVSHGHDISILRENQGVVLVIEKDQDLGFEIPQLLISSEKFEDWFTKNSLRIIQDTTAPYKKSKKERKIPKLWFSYLRRGRRRGEGEGSERPRACRGPKGCRRLARPPASPDDQPRACFRRMRAMRSCWSMAFRSIISARICAAPGLRRVGSPPA